MLRETTTAFTVYVTIKSNHDIKLGAELIGGEGFVMSFQTYIVMKNCYFFSVCLVLINALINNAKWLAHDSQSFTKILRAKTINYKIKHP